MPILEHANGRKVDVPDEQVDAYTAHGWSKPAAAAKAAPKKPAAGKATSEK